jgi:hypothetical protein
MGDKAPGGRLRATLKRGFRPRGADQIMTSHEIYRYRLATSNDASAIFAVLEEVAPEIPVCLDNPNRKDGDPDGLFRVEPGAAVQPQHPLAVRIQEGIGSGNVWIALDRDNQVVGFLLAEPDRKALELTYGGVRTSHRGNDIFPTLVKKMMPKGVPLTATVLHSNKSDMVNRLLKLGFTQVYPWPKTDRDFLRWQP